MNTCEKAKTHPLWPDFVAFCKRVLNHDLDKTDRLFIPTMWAAFVCGAAAQRLIDKNESG